jgi:cell division septal protein FtsQ
MPPNRKRKRTRIRMGPFLVLAVIGVFISGIFYSPLTSLSKVIVVGARSAHVNAIEAVLSDTTNVKNIPWARMNTRWVETQVQRIQAVDHADYSQNVFGRGRLEVFYRVPIARIRAEEKIGMDANGVMFKTDELPLDLPLVVRSDTAKDLPVSIMSGFPSRKVAELALIARRMEPAEKLTISFDRAGFLRLNIGSGIVILGSSVSRAQRNVGSGTRITGGREP